MKVASLIALIAAIAIAVGAYFSVYVVDETKQAVVTAFGRVVGEPKTTAGLGWKLPWHKAKMFPKNLQEWDGEPGELPTLEKTLIWVDTFGRWKIVDPVAFYRTANNVPNAKERLSDIIDPAVRDAIASYPLNEIVRQSNRVMEDSEFEEKDEQSKSRIKEVKTGRKKITDGVRQFASEQLKSFGIELVDVKIKRLNYVSQVRQSVYGRMIAERKQIAEKYRSEGQGEARRIQGDMELKLKEIRSEAYKTAQEIKGRADGAATKIYAEAYSKDPEFYSFSKTLDVYRNTMDPNSTLVLSTDSEFYHYLKNDAPEQ